MIDLPNPSSQFNASRVVRRLFPLACLVVCAAAGPLQAQQASDRQAAAKAAAPVTAQSDTKETPPDTATPPAQPAVTDPHQAQIIADTQKLVKLSQELKAEVAKSSKDTLSLTVIKKAEEVEKLAKTLKDELGKSH
jgi:sRNA-binding protein